MNNHDSNAAGRRLLLGGLGIAAVAGMARAGESAPAPSRSGRREPKRYPQDAWMDALPGEHRVFIDTDSATGVPNALRYATNILNAQASAYQGTDRDLAIIVCLRHASTTLGYNDAMWAKYGASLGMLGRPAGGREGEAPPAKNAQTAALAAAAARGVHFAICGTATTLMSGMLARQAGAKAEDVYAEIAANIVPNGHMVPAGVMALTRAQEYGYSFLYAAA